MVIFVGGRITFNRNCPWDIDGLMTVCVCERKRVTEKIIKERKREVYRGNIRYLTDVGFISLDSKPQSTILTSINRIEENSK